jgi:penicillin G amidase
MRIAVRIVKGLGAFVLIILMIIGLWAGWLTWRFHQSTPDYSASLQSELYAPVIARDAHGVAHISGETPEAVWFGLGYAHAEDRLFEMDLMRRSIWGTLGEVIPAFISKDIALSDAEARMRGHDATTRAIYANLPDDARQAMMAYAHGVNAFIDQRRSKWPFAYALLATKPARWQPEDCVTAALTMTHMLSVGSGHNSGPNLPETSDKLQRARAIYAGQYPEGAITSIHAEDLSAQRVPASPLPDLGDEARPGSNSWVLAGTRTVSGLPLLANDPHLPPGLPSIWFLARLSMPQGNIVGATIPGVPYVVIGRNDHVAWGITNASIDVRDAVALDAGGPVTTQTQPVKRRLAQDFDVVVQTTPLGYARTMEAQAVLHRSLASRAKLGTFNDYVIRHTDDDQDNLTAYALHRFQFARTVDDLLKAADDYWVAPVQTLVMADVDGNIGFAAVGRIPRRAADGTWIDDLEAGGGLQVINPERGFGANGNNRIQPETFPHPLPGYYALDRVERAYAMILAQEKHDLASMKAMQLDQTSPLAAQLVSLWETARPITQGGEALRLRLIAWDGVMRADASAPTIYADWVRLFTNEISRDERELDEDDPVDTSLRSLFLRSVASGENADWCDHTGTPEAETCAELAGAAFDKLAARTTPFEDWADRRIQRFTHPLLSSLPWIGTHWQRTARIGGDGTTLNVAHAPLDGVESAISLSTNYRMIIDFAALDESLFVHAPGQSSHPKSPYFDALLDDWKDGHYITISTLSPVEDMAAEDRITRFEPDR